MTVTMVVIVAAEVTARVIYDFYKDRRAEFDKFTELLEATDKVDSGQLTQGIDLEIGPGEIHAVMGPNGSGKSTLLHLLGAVDSPTSGAVFLDGSDVTSMSDPERARFRLEHVGLVGIPSRGLRVGDDFVFAFHGPGVGVGQFDPAAFVQRRREAPTRTKKIGTHTQPTKTVPNATTLPAASVVSPRAKM